VHATLEAIGESAKTTPTSQHLCLDDHISMLCEKMARVQANPALSVSGIKAFQRI
jgi:hypothetical protein